ncbi:MAG TPA: DUF4397 domain-containing protein [Gammaproteobacteria bacterium]
MRSALRLTLVLLAVAACFGCDQGRKAPPKTNVQVVHAAPGAPAIDFYRERRSTVSQLQYGGASGVLLFDEDTYDFSVHTVQPSGATPVLQSFSKAVVAGTDYTFVFTEVGGLIEPIILEAPRPEAGSADAQVMAVHAGPAQGPVDIFVEPPGADLATATPLATLAFTQSIAPVARAAGEHVVTLTEPGNPANVLFQSTPATLAGGATTLLVIIDAANQGTDTRRVLLVRDGSTPLIDKNATSAIRVVNAAGDGAARDVAVAGQFSPPLFAAVPFGTASAYATVGPGDNELSVTPAGNPGVVEATHTVTAEPGRSYTAVVAGAPGSVKMVSVSDDRRPVADRAKIALLNGASQFSAVLFHVLDVGGNPDERQPDAILGAPGATQYVERVAGTYEIVLRNQDNVTVAGPVPITVANGGIYTVLATNGPDASTANVVLRDGF